MNVKVKKSDLKKALSLVKKALPKLIIQEERGHILCNISDNKATLMATDNDLKSYCEIDIIESSDAFSFTLEPKIIEKILNKTEVDELVIEHNPEDYTTKIYTKSGTKNFSTIQSFPPSTMLTFEKPEFEPNLVDRESFVYTLKFSKNYLAPLKEDLKQFDFVIIHKGIVFSANGSNKMGFIVLKTFSDIENYKIRKAVVPAFLNFASTIITDKISLIQTERDIGLVSEDGKAYLSCLLSNVEPPNIKYEHIKSEGSYCSLNKDVISKALDRLLANNRSSSGAGIELKLEGKEENSYIDMSLVSTLDCTERIPCKRINDESSEEVKHVVECSQLKSILDSFESKQDMRFHFDNETRFFKIFNTNTINKNKYISVAVGAYSKIIRQ